MATTAKLNEWLAAGAVTTAGIAISSGVVRFYQPGTLTPQTVYSDAAAASAITQPVVLSAGGVALVYATAPVRMIVKDASDTNTLFDVTENVDRADQLFVTSTAFNGGTETALSTLLDGWTTSAGGSAGIFKYKRSVTATERNLKDAIGEARISAKDRGAAGDGVANDTAALAAAITEISAAGGGVVFLPAGTYLIDSVLSLPANVSLIGVTSGVSILKQITAATGALLLSAAGNGNNVLQGFQVTHNATSTAIAISCVTTNSIVLRDVRVASGKFRTGVKFNNCSDTAIYESYIFALDSASGLGRCIHYTTGGKGHFVCNTSVSVDATGSCFELDTGDNTFTLLAVRFLSGTFGVRLTSSSNDDVVRVIACQGLNANVGTPFIETTSPAARGLFQIGNFIDGAPNIDLTSGGTATPAPLTSGQRVRIRGTTTGAAYNIAALATNPIQRGYQVVLELFNNAGGAVTGWTFNAFWHTSGAVSTTDLAKTSIVFEFDGNASCMREVARAVTT